MGNQFNKLKKKCPSICTPQRIGDDLCMFYALENAFQDIGCLDPYIDQRAQK